MKIYLYALLAVAATLVFHIIGLDGGYMALPIYDVFMHILGGLAIGLALLAVFRTRAGSSAHFARNIVIGVFIAGLAWELFEVVYDLAGYPLWTTNYYLDTLKDLLDDIIGGIVAVTLMLQ